jgi:hypothetical protein
MGSPSEVGSLLPGSALGTSMFAPTQFRGTNVLTCPRFQELDRRQAYYDCTQHDEKKYDFDGRQMTLKGPGAMATIPLLNSQVAPFMVPLAARRPSAPMRLGRVIVNAFTNMVFGTQRFPNVKVEGDADTQDFADQLKRSTALPIKMIRARNIGGSVGTVGLSWCYDRLGRPRVETHNGKYLYVHEWDDREELIPAWVTEVYLYSRDEWDGTKRKFVRNWYWYRRDWNEDEDILFQEVLYKAGQEPAWTPDAANSVTHGDGFCHLTWIQNLPNEEIDGLPDYDTLYEKFDRLDILLSVVTKGAILNLDPTLILKMDREIAIAMGVVKGSDNSMSVGPDGDAEYLELSGTSLEAGIKLMNEMRRWALETAQCIVPDPSDIAAQGVSAVALKAIFAPMLGKCETYREQYGSGMKRMLEQMIEVARLKVGTSVTVYNKDDAGNIVPEERTLVVNLPPKVVRKPKLDDQGAPAFDDAGKAQESVEMVARAPGEGGELDLAWPQYFPPTPDDQTKTVTALSTASGGKPIISQQTAVEQVASVYGVEPTEEWARVQKMGAADDDKAAAQAKAFGADGDAAGGKVGEEGGLPPGAKPKPSFGGSKPPFGGGAKKPDDGSGPPPPPARFGQ